LFNIRGSVAIATGILGPSATPEQIALKIEQLGLDRPLAVRYIDWLGGMLTGDLGRSSVNGTEVTDILLTRVPVTLSLVVMTLSLTVAFAVPLGVLAATRGGTLDRGMQLLSVVVGAVPGYWLALVFVIVFSLTLHLFPATGFIPITKSFSGWLSTILLPSVSLALATILGLAVWVRSAIQMLGLLIIGLLGGTIIVERIYALPGVGTMAISAGAAGDVPVVLAGVTFLVIVVVVVNLIVDLVNGFLNPKARVS